MWSPDAFYRDDIPPLFGGTVTHILLRQKTGGQASAPESFAPEAHPCSVAEALERKRPLAETFLFGMSREIHAG